MPDAAVAQRPHDSGEQFARFCLDLQKQVHEPQLALTSHSNVKNRGVTICSSAS